MGRLCVMTKRQRPCVSPCQRHPPGVCWREKEALNANLVLWLLEAAGRQSSAGALGLLSSLLSVRRPGLFGVSQAFHRSEGLWLWGLLLRGLLTSSAPESSTGLSRCCLQFHRGLWNLAVYPLTGVRIWDLGFVFFHLSARTHTHTHRVIIYAQYIVYNT